MNPGQMPSNIDPQHESSSPTTDYYTPFATTSSPTSLFDTTQSPHPQTILPHQHSSSSLSGYLNAPIKPNPISSNIMTATTEGVDIDTSPRGISSMKSTGYPYDNNTAYNSNAYTAITDRYAPQPKPINSLTLKSYTYDNNTNTSINNSMYNNDNTIYNNNTTNTTSNKSIYNNLSSRSATSTSSIQHLPYSNNNASNISPRSEISDYTTSPRITNTTNNNVYSNNTYNISQQQQQNKKYLKQNSIYPINNNTNSRNNNIGNISGNNSPRNSTLYDPSPKYDRLIGPKKSGAISPRTPGTGALSTDPYSTPAVGGALGTGLGQVPGISKPVLYIGAHVVKDSLIGGCSWLVIYIYDMMMVTVGW